MDPQILKQMELRQAFRLKLIMLQSNSDSFVSQFTLLRQGVDGNGSAHRAALCTSGRASSKSVVPELLLEPAQRERNRIKRGTPSFDAMPPVFPNQLSSDPWAVGFEKFVPRLTAISPGIKEPNSDFSSHDTLSSKRRTCGTPRMISPA